MASRGPDGKGIWLSSDGCIGLAHRRLSIIDLSDAGSQPMFTENGRLGVVFNGEIYNYRQLRNDLLQKGYCFRSNSDTEVLLHLYAEYGQQMVHKLRGMYSFAIWDEEAKGLFLARDPFGIKPLYYADDGYTVRVASQVKALLASGMVDTSPEPAGHVGFFLWGNVPEPYTLHKGIRSLQAGSSLYIDCAGKKLFTQFCSIPRELTMAAEQAIPLSRSQMCDQLREAIIDTVRHHLVADVPVGVFLSAGLDSTTLAALVAEVSPGSLNTITLGFGEFSGTENDEVPLAEEVAQYYGSLHKTISVARKDFKSELPLLLDAMDQPSIDGVNSYFVCKAAQQAGLKVVLSGLGGDELFGSYPSFRQIPRLVKNIRPYNAMPGLGTGFRMVAAPLLKSFTSPKYAGLLEYGGSYGGAYLLRRGMFMPWELPNILDGDMVREGWRELQTMRRLNEAVSGISNEHLKVASLEMCWFMRNQLLRDIDWASMAHSLEVRTPFVDLELLRKAVPLILGSASPFSKSDIGQTPLKPLPSAVINRPKTGFSVPVRDWLLEGKIAGGERGLRSWAKQVYKSF